MQALCAEEVYAMDKDMKGVVGVQLCLERQLKSGVFPSQVGRWNAREQTWGDYSTNVIDYDYLPPVRLRLRISKITL